MPPTRLGLTQRMIVQQVLVMDPSAQATACQNAEGPYLRKGKTYFQAKKARVKIPAAAITTAIRRPRLLRCCLGRRCCFGRTAGFSSTAALFLGPTISMA